MTDWYYPLPNFTSGNPLSDLATHANAVTGNNFWSIIILFIMSVMFFVFNRSNETDKSLLGAMTIGATAALFLSLGSWVSPDLVIFMWLLTGVIALWVYYNGR